MTDGDDKLDEAAIAHVCHEAMRAYRSALGEPPLEPWADAPDWQVEATLAAVRFRMDNPNAPASAQHEQWIAEKRASGWRYGEEKSATRKTHPMMTPYTELPLSERRKDALMQSVIDALTKDWCI